MEITKVIACRLHNFDSITVKYWFLNLIFNDFILKVLFCLSFDFKIKIAYFDKLIQKYLFYELNTLKESHFHRINHSTFSNLVIHFNCYL